MTDDFELEPDSDDPREWPSLWAVPVEDPEVAVPPTPEPPSDDPPPLYHTFRGSDTPPSIGFTPRLSRDNEDL